MVNHGRCTRRPNISTVQRRVVDEVEYEVFRASRNQEFSANTLNNPSLERRSAAVSVKNSWNEPARQKSGYSITFLILAKLIRSAAVSSRAAVFRCSQCGGIKDG
jgi:hypothetical protein